MSAVAVVAAGVATKCADRGDTGVNQPRAGLLRPLVGVVRAWRPGCFERLAPALRAPGTGGGRRFRFGVGASGGNREPRRPTPRATASPATRPTNLDAVRRNSSRLRRSGRRCSPAVKPDRTAKDPENAALLSLPWVGFGRMGSMRVWRALLAITPRAVASYGLKLHRMAMGPRDEHRSGYRGSTKGASLGVGVGVRDRSGFNDCRGDAVAQTRHARAVCSGQHAGQAPLDQKASTGVPCADLEQITGQR